MSVEVILKAPPAARRRAAVLASCIDEYVACAATCTVCADACRGEDDVQARLPAAFGRARRWLQLRRDRLPA